MSESFQDMASSVERAQIEATGLIRRLLDVARPESVYGAPQQSGDYIVITASEVTAGMGFGLGTGYGQGPQAPKPGSADRPTEAQQAGGGGGGGGGGGAAARPVAVISIGPNGVQIEPIVDVTKITIAVFTTLGAMALMFSRMRRQARR